MFSKKEVLTMVNVLMLSVTIGMNVNFGSVENENVEPDKMTILSTNTENVEYENTAVNSNEISRKATMTDDDVWQMQHDDSEYFMYVPLKATKSVYNDIEYFYLNDNQGGMYIVFGDSLVDGGNYIAEMGVYSDDIYELELGGFEFTDEAEQSFEDYSIMDKKVAEKILEEMLLEI